MQKQNNENGYIALSSVLVISAVVLVISITTALLSISEAQMSLSDEKGRETLDFVEGCTEEALLRLNEEDDLSTQIALPEGNCDVTVESHVGDNWTFTVEKDLAGAPPEENYQKKLRVSATRNTEMTITSWQEISP